jgi:hypothetical protein
MRSWTLPALIATLLVTGLVTEAVAKERKARSRRGGKTPAAATAADTKAATEPDAKASEAAPSSGSSAQPAADAAEAKPDTPEEAPAPAEVKPAQVQVFCSLPGADVLVDDVVVGKTPLADAVTVTPGKHVFELQRPGYMHTRREITLTEGARASVAFHPEEDPDADDPRGRLVIGGDAGDVHVTIDGRSRGKYRKAISLPAGPHLVRLERKGFEPVEELTQVGAGDELELKTPAQPTQETRATASAHTQTYKHWAIAALITGAVIAGGSTGVAVWGHSKIGGAEDKLDQVKRDNEAVGCNSPGAPEARLFVCQQDLSKAQNDVDKYKNLRTYGMVGAGVGAAVIATGVVLWLIAPDANPHDREEARLLPVISAGPDGASLWLRGSF